MVIVFIQDIVQAILIGSTIQLPEENRISAFCSSKGIAFGCCHDYNYKVKLISGVFEHSVLRIILLEIYGLYGP